MITILSGDILLSEAQAIAHGVAPADHFNQGLAMALRDRYPAMAKDFRSWCHQNHPDAGGAWMWAGPDADGITRVIVNLMTQDPAPDHKAHPGRASHRNIDHALKELARIARAQRLTSIALPRLATGVGGMAWEDVLPLIEKNLGDLDCPVLIYETYVAGQKANENLPKAA